MTNGDKIRKFSDEELAEIFRHFICPCALGIVSMNGCKANCKQCWIDFFVEEELNRAEMT